MIAHPLAVAGLALNTVGAVMLLWFPPSVRAFDDEGHELATRVAIMPAVPHGRLRNWLIKWGSRLAIVLLLLGFALQLVDLLIG